MIPKRCSDIDDYPVVCLVDDDPIIRALFSKVIQRTGCTVVTASGVEQAAAILEQQTIHIVLSDLMMPQRDDGEQLLAFVTSRYPALPVCMMSGDWSPELISRLLKSGACRCVTKPFSAESFEELVDGLDW